VGLVFGQIDSAVKLPVFGQAQELIALVGARRTGHKSI